MNTSSNQASERDISPFIGRLYEVELLRELEEDGLPEALEEKSGRPAEAKAQADRPLPFVERIVAYTPGVSVTVERSLSLDEDLHLADHAFVHAPGVKPLSACLPIVPMTLSLEIMAEAAACLAPGYGLIGFEDIKATRWIELADIPGLRLRIHAEVAQFDSAHEVCHIAAAIHVEDQTAPAIQARVLFAPHYLLELSLEFTELTEVHRYPLNAEEIYETRHLFHGPTYQCLVGDIFLGQRGAVGNLLVKAPSGLFRSTDRPQLLTDPALLDAVGQLIGIWAMERERYVFPIGIKKLELYRPTPPPGTEVPVRIEITRDEGKTLYADVEIQDGSGGVWMRIKDWGDWKFRWERRLLNFRRLPTRYLLGEPMDLPGVAPDALCVGVSPADIAGFDTGLLARFYLHMDEMQAFADKRGFDRRQQQWLLGRIAAKDAVRAWLARQAGDEEMLHPAAFTIDQDEKGRPRVVLEGLSQEGPLLSIAHCEDRAIAIAHGGAVGVDIEPIAPRDSDFIDTFATEAERDLLKEVSGPSDLPDEWVTRLWCAKEAAGKFLGLGFNGSPKVYEAQSLDQSGLIHILHRDSGRTVVVRSSRRQDFVIAYAGAEKAASPHAVA